MPPSTVITEPLTYAAAGDRSQETSPATSSGSPGRRAGAGRVASAYAPSLSVPRRAARSSIEPSAIAVRIHPGHTAFARTPRGPKSTAMDCTVMLSPALLVQYAADPAPALSADTDDTATSAPRRSTRWGSAARAVR